MGKVGLGDGEEAELTGGYANVDGEIVELTGGYANVDGETIQVWPPGAAIPDSVVNQYRSEDFADPWPDQVGSVDMSVFGLTESTFNNGETSIFGDGVDDNGQAAVTELASQETFGMALTVEYENVSEFSCFFGVNDDGTVWTLRTENGEISLRLRDDNNNSFMHETDNSYDDGNVHAVVVNKLGDSSGDVDFYVDDMENSVASSARIIDNWDSSNWSSQYDPRFFARDHDGSLSAPLDMDAGIFEFNSEPYSEDDRNGFVSRRPEV